MRNKLESEKIQMSKYKDTRTWNYVLAYLESRHKNLDASCSDLLPLNWASSVQPL